MQLTVIQQFAVRKMQFEKFVLGSRLKNTADCNPNDCSHKKKTVRPICVGQQPLKRSWLPSSSLQAKKPSSGKLLWAADCDTAADCNLNACRKKITVLENLRNPADCVLQLVLGQQLGVLIKINTITTNYGRQLTVIQQLAEKKNQIQQTCVNTHTVN